MRHLARARDYAEKGGHEDIRYRILVSEVHIDRLAGKDKLADMLDAQVKLREAQHYAEVMGVRSLLVDVLHLQGLMLLRSGDFSSSGRLITKAMAIARRNEMGLRLNAAMSTYADVLLARRRIDSARRLLSDALAMAKRNEYSTEVVRIHELVDKVERFAVIRD